MFLVQKMRFLTSLDCLLLMGFCILGISNSDDSSWRSGPPDGLPELKKLLVECGKEEMTVHLEFSAPYDGTIYSKSSGQSQKCTHVAPHSHVTEATFSIDYHSCGTRSESQGKYYENTIIIQYDDIVIEAWDEAKKIRCEWHDGYEKSAYKMPITISDLDVVEMNFQGDDVDCWLEVQDGKGPWSAKVEGLVPLGSPLTLVVAIQDSEGHFDMRVKSCIAHDGYKHPIHLTDEDGCVLRPKMMSPFQKTSDTKGTASVIAYSHFYAFKFPETVEVTIQCTVEICRHGCPDTCLQGRDPSNPIDAHLPAQGKEQDDVPTYKDTHAFSTVITSKPGNLNSSSTINTSANSTLNAFETNKTKNEGDEPLKSSPDTHHDFYMDRFPYDLYDMFEAEERQDTNEHELYTDTEENEYSDAKDSIYFPQSPNMFAKMNEQGKNFSPNQIIHNITTNIENITNGSEDSNSTEVNAINEENESSAPEQHSDTKEILNNIQNDSVTEVKTETRNPEIKKVQTEIPVSDEPMSSDEYQTYTDLSQEHAPSADKHESHIKTLQEQTQSAVEYHSYAKTNQDNTLNQLFSSELFEEDSPELKAPEKKDELIQEKTPIQIKEETLHDSNVNMESTTELGNLKESNDYKEKSDFYEYGEKRMIENDNIERKILPNKYFESLKTKPRMPIDENEMGHNLHNFNYRPFKPPAPVPPLTLYNGVPLHYYNHPNVDELFESDGHPYMGGQPYYKEFIKSKLRRPGRRRGRREIGEKEQLGLKQTLRVIATTDLDFIVQDDRENKPFYTGKTDIANEVCIAPSSFAAGLGLLLLANVCVLCVVSFWGHHYYKYRNRKVKNTELLCTEMS